jgi:hypothetical protein
MLKDTYGGKKRMKQLLEKNTRKPSSGGYGNINEYAPKKVLSTHTETDPSHNNVMKSSRNNPPGGKSESEGPSDEFDAEEASEKEPKKEKKRGFAKLAGKAK